ncbi:MAG: hypothetical protein O2825_12830 [Proteobacteria bacterium]|nr:hypothetical protein [Pseudomonadota bacterium]
MSGLAKYLEDEGLATTLVALVRKQAEQVVPPRALWVPYPLGRPFGVPGDAAFQTRVLRAAMALLDAPSGPLLVDHDEEAPQVAAAADEEGEGWVCPVSFPRAPAESEGARLDAVLAEIAELAPWYNVGLSRRGRTTMGVSGMKPEAMARFLSAWTEGTTRQSPIEGVAPAEAIRQASEDLKAYYFEAATARPGPDAGEALTAWFWHETAAADLLRALQVVCFDDADPAVHDVGDFMLVPSIYR